MIFSHIAPQTQEKLEIFADLLRQWNSKINLISPKDIPHLWERHIEDSFQLAQLIPPKSTVTDLGSGGGFPGIILAIATNLPVTLIESDQRKCAFLREASRLCALNTTIISKRIETVIYPPANIITARALAPLEMLLQWSRPLLEKTGSCYFLKGQKLEEEILEAQKRFSFSYEKFPSKTSENGTIIKIQKIIPL